jgi:DHA1 family tetracycline resistance protein-like MFS transporter
VLSRSLSLYLLLCIGFVDIAGVGLVYPMFASMLYQPGSTLIAPEASETFRGICLGILLAMMPITQFFSSPLLGAMSDKRGRKAILVPALAVGVVGYAIAFIAVLLNSFMLLLLSRVAIGISSGSVSVVSASLADVSSTEDKATNFGLLNMACGLGFTVGPFVGGVLSNSSLGLFPPFALPFVAAGVVSLANLIVAYLFFQDSYSPAQAEMPSWTMGITNIRKAFFSQELRVFFAAIFFACVGWSFHWEFTPVTWIKDFDFSAVTIGNFYAYGAAVYAISCGLLIRPIISRFSNEHIVCYALAACGIFIGALLFHTDPFWLLVYIPLQQFAVALFWPTAAAFISNSVSEEVQGEFLGIFHSVEALAFAVTPLIAGPLLELVTPLLVGSLAMLFAALLLWLTLEGSLVTAPSRSD